MSNEIKPRELKKPLKQRAFIPSERQALAVKHLVEHGGSKREALIAVGYSQAMADNPERVFGSPKLQKLLAEHGISENTVFSTLSKRMRRKKIMQVKIPLHQNDVDIDDKGEYKKSYSMLTDGDLHDLYDNEFSKIKYIDVRKSERIVYLEVPHDELQTDTINKFIAILGMEAPKNLKLDGNVNHNFTLSGLRKKMEENNVQIIEPRIIDI